MGKIIKKPHYTDVEVSIADMFAEMTPLWTSLYRFCYHMLCRKVPDLAECAEYGTLKLIDGKVVGRFYNYPKGKGATNHDESGRTPPGV